MMKINEIRSTKTGSYIELSAMINNYRLWYRVPRKYNVSNTGDPFLAAAFFPSMVTGETLIIDNKVNVSPKLINGIIELQNIFNCWNPTLKKFKLGVRENRHQSVNNGVASFFSGGIDGLYTLIKHTNEITHLLFINGFDFEMSSEVFESAIERNSQLAAIFDKILVPIETNFFRFILQYRVSRPLNHGSCLASVALALGFPKTYVAASHTYKQFHPWGTTALTDPLWSSEGTQIIHDGADAPRTKKTIKVANSKAIIDKLVVCWREPDSNCGKCGKCIRTILTLNLLGVKSAAFKSYLRITEIIKLNARSYSDLSYFYENLELAITQRNFKMAKILKVAILKSKIILFLVDFDRRYLGKTLRRLSHLIRYGKYRDEPKRIKPIPE